jgi:hypothetical protein
MHGVLKLISLRHAPQETSEWRWLSWLQESPLPQNLRPRICMAVILPQRRNLCCRTQRTPLLRRAGDCGRRFWKAPRAAKMLVDVSSTGCSELVCLWYFLSGDHSCMDVGFCRWDVTDDSSRLMTLCDDVRAWAPAMRCPGPQVVTEKAQCQMDVDCPAAHLPSCEEGCAFAPSNSNIHIQGLAGHYSSLQRSVVARMRIRMTIITV